jgi:serine/threonine protein kinase
MPETQARIIFRQLISGVQYCHAHLVVHRDLKPENVMIDVSGNVKISDFGLSNILKPGRLCTTFCGSPIYCPPEVVLQQQYNGTLVDVWSLGVMLYVMVTGGMPWRLERNVVKNMADLIAANYAIPDCLGISLECRLLIRMMLTADSKKRATVAMIANHPWVNIGFDGPPKVLLKPLPLIPKKEINEDIMQQLFELGIDVWQARIDLQFVPDSPALTTYHILLEKHMNRSKFANLSMPDANTTLSQPKSILSAQMFRKRASTIPSQHSSLHTQNALPDETFIPQSSLLTKDKSATDHGILHNIFIYFEKIKKQKKTKTKDSIPMQHNSPTHSPTNLRKRHV